METVFILHHVAREDAPDEDVKLMGVYSTSKAAEDAIGRLCSLPGFRDYPSGFHVEKYRLDQDHWEEGFMSCDEAIETESSSRSATSRSGSGGTP